MRHKNEPKETISMDFYELERLKSALESLRNGDYTKTVSYEESGIGKLDVRLRKIDDDISKYHSDQKGPAGSRRSSASP